MPLERPEFADFVRARAPRELEADEGYLSGVRDNIVEYGWHIQAVFPGPGRIGWAYTIGFMDTLGVPDIVVFGLPGDVGRRLLNDIGDAIVAGRRFADDHRYRGFLVDVDVLFKPVLPTWGGAHFGRARDWYGSWPDVRQVVLPDLANRMPGEAGNEAEGFQMLLYSDDPAPRLLAHEHTPIPVEDGLVAIAADVLGRFPSGWEEKVIVWQDDRPDRAIVSSVPFVDYLVFGDEVELGDVDGVLRIVGIPGPAPVSTMRCSVLRSDDETRAALDDLLTAAEQNEIVWESPVDHWLFFGVPHHRYATFEALVRPLSDRGMVSAQNVRRPPPPTNEP